MDNWFMLTMRDPRSLTREPFAVAPLRGNSMVLATRRCLAGAGVEGVPAARPLLGSLPALIGADDGHPNTMDPRCCFGLLRPLTGDQTATLRWW